jgi:hypothetical protein
MKKMVVFLGSAMLVFLLGGCDSKGTPEEVIPSEEDDLVQPTSGKADTGYYSDMATELQGEFVSSLRLDLSSMSADEKENYIRWFNEGNKIALDVIKEQIKFGKNQLDAEMLHMNLYSNDIGIDSVEAQGDLLVVQYRSLVESLVVIEELKEKGVELGEIVGAARTIVLPSDPVDLYLRIGDTCATHPAGGTIASHNYFYYFDPAKEECNVDTIEATFTVSELAPPDTTYPEYDKLVEDGKITTVVFFGQVGHGELNEQDPGVFEWTQFVRYMTNRDFDKVEDLDPGERYLRVQKGIEATVDIISPYDLEFLNTDEGEAIFKRAVKEHEIVIYNGHAFYGSLDILTDREAYPESTYQIFLMDACWSYEYYTTQIFENKVNAEDPHGWKYADIVNNTEPTWAHNNAEVSRIMLTNILKGAETGGIDVFGRYYTWNNIIVAINKFVLESFEVMKDVFPDRIHGHELYGVSGIKNNSYDPEVGDDDDPLVNGKEYVNTTATEIPDNDENGVMSEIYASENIIPTQIRVFVDISHAYIGDLVVSLVRGDEALVLHDREGSYRENIIKEYDIADNRFTGVGALGNWYLKVADKASGDQGKIKSWSLTLIP